jgi:phosphoribosylformylglycinamidine synthase
MSSGQSDEDLDYASVQRGNPEMQRRCQEVIDRCWAQGENNPIKSIHDVGAGGLSNAIPELLHDGGVGGQLDLRAIPSADAGLAPVEIWCNEAQERTCWQSRRKTASALSRFASASVVPGPTSVRPPMTPACT